MFGRLVHKSVDELGVIEVIENGGERSLHFGSGAKQSALHLHTPQQLALSYTRAMMAPLLFHPSPRRILIIGLGGGSLATFLLYHFPDCSIDAIELRPKVIEVAHSHFFLPRDKRLHIITEEAGRFIHGSDYLDYRHYDLILVDAFSEGGIARSVCGIAFFEKCRERLSRSGWLSMNLWSGDFISAGDLLRDLGEVFGSPALRLEVEGRENIIGLAYRERPSKPELKPLPERSKELQMQLAIEFPALLKGLRRLNPDFF